MQKLEEKELKEDLLYDLSQDNGIELVTEGLVNCIEDTFGIRVDDNKEFLDILDVVFRTVNSYKNLEYVYDSIPEEEGDRFDLMDFEE